MEVSLISSLPLQENRYGTVQQDLSPTLSNTSNRLCKSTLKCYVGVVASFVPSCNFFNNKTGTNGNQKQFSASDGLTSFAAKEVEPETRSS